MSFAKYIKFNISVFLCYYLVISLFKINPKYSIKELSRVLKRKMAEMCIIEKIHMINKFCSGTNHGANCHEVNDNESRILNNMSLNRNNNKFIC